MQETGWVAMQKQMYLHLEGLLDIAQQQQNRYGRQRLCEISKFQLPRSTFASEMRKGKFKSDAFEKITLAKKIFNFLEFMKNLHFHQILFTFTRYT